MNGLTEQDLQMIDRKVEELTTQNEELTARNEELTARISNVSSDNTLLKDWIEENYLPIQEEWTRLRQKKEELSSEESRIQSLSKMITSKEESIRAYEQRVKDRESSAWVKENSYGERVRSLDRKEEEFWREKTKFDEQKEEFEKEKKKNLQVKRYIQQDLELLRAKTKMDAEREFEWIYPIFKILFIFTIASLLVSGILSGMLTVDVLDSFSGIRRVVLIVFGFFGACAGKVDAPVAFLNGLLSVIIGVIIPGLIVLVMVAVIVAGCWVYKKRYWDKTSLVFVLASAGLLSFVGGYLRSVIPVNCLALFFALQIVYVVVRVIADLRNPLSDIWYWRDR